jgi:hypothetical protein
MEDTDNGSMFLHLQHKCFKVFADSKVNSGIMKQTIRIPKDADVPLIGTVMFGCIDRGTNLIQVRPTTKCTLNCIFCSTDSGPFSKTRVTEYVVDIDYLLEWFRYLAKFKGNYKLIAFIDSVGDPLTYPKIVDLVQELSDVRGVEDVSIETSGMLLTEEKINELYEAGLTKINISLHALDSKLAKKLVGTENYDVTRIMKIIEHIAESPIELMITPVWIPGLNDEEIPKVIEFVKKINRNKKYPCLGVQKYEAHKYGRKPKGVKEITWWKFYKQLEGLEKKFNIKLKIGPRDLGIHRRKMLPYAFEKGEKVNVEVKAPGWMQNEMICVARNRCVTVLNCNANIGDLVKIKIIRNKHNLYVAEKV